MRESHRLEAWGTGVALVLLVGIAYQPSWHAGLSGEDFPGHVALLQRLLHWLGDAHGPPLWTRDWGSGSSLVLPYLHPLLALLLLSPFTLLFGPELGLRVGDTCFLALAGISMLVWCRSLGASHLTAALGGLCYAVHPMVVSFVGRSGQVHHPITMAVLPLLFLGFRRLAQQPTPARLALTSLAISALAIDMQRFWLLLPFVLLAYLLTDPLPRSARALSTRVGWAALAGLGSGLLLCFPVLPALLERPELMGHPPELLEGYRRSFPVPHLLTLLDRASALSGPLEAAAATRSGIAAGVAYQGLVPLLLLVIGIVTSLRDPAARALRAALAATTAAAALALALGMGNRVLLPRHRLVLEALLEGQPGFLPWLALIFVALSALLMLWLWISVARERGPRTGSLAILAPVAVVGCALLLGSVAPFRLLVELPLYGEVRGPAHFTFPLLPFLLGTGVALILPGLLTRRPPGIPAWAVVALLAALHLIDISPYREQLRPSRSIAEERALRDAFGELANAPAGRILTSEDHAPLAEMLGVIEARKPAAWSWLAWSTQRNTGDLMRYGVFGALHAAREQLGVGAGEFAALTAGLANVRYFARVEGETEPLPGSEHLHKLVDRAGAQLYENRAALAYAQFYPALALLSGPREQLPRPLVQLAYSGIASYALPQAEGVAPPPALSFDFAHGTRARAALPQAASLEHALRKPAGGAPQDSPCETAERGQASIVLQCRFARPGYLVVAESWSPRWQAHVDGVLRPLYRMNLAFQGIAVSPRDREIHLSTRPSWAVRSSLAISALSWASLLGYWLWQRRPARHDSRSNSPS